MLITDDDCTVAGTWLDTGCPRTRQRILMGQDRARASVADAIAVPSLVGAVEPSEYSGSLHYDVLFGCNMARGVAQHSLE